MSKILIFFVVWIAVVVIGATALLITKEPDRFKICPLCGEEAGQ